MQITKNINLISDEVENSVKLEWKCDTFESVVFHQVIDVTNMDKVIFLTNVESFSNSTDKDIQNNWFPKAKKQIKILNKKLTKDIYGGSL